MFCPNCGKQLPDDSRFCGSCGSKIGSSSTGPKPSFQKQGGFSWKEARKATVLPREVANLIIGIIAVIWALVTYSNDTSKILGGYNYSSPLTSHEVFVIVLGLGGAACLICGIIDLIVYSKIKK